MWRYIMGLKDMLDLYGVSRRDFMKFCTATCAALSLPATMAPKVADALEKNDTRPPVIWTEFQSCTGDSEGLLRSERPKVAELILDVLSVDYMEVIQAASGHLAEESKQKTMKEYKGKYIYVVEGSIPTAEGGIYCCTAGKSAVDILKETAADAAMIIAVGNCAAFGGIPAGHPNPTGAVGVMDIIKDKPIVNLPGCPMNADNLTALIVHYLVFGSLPALDSKLRPKFAYGKRIHDNCERRAHFDAGQFVEIWGDDGHKQGWCLYKMGCKGPETFHNCPTLKWNEGTSWPVQAGHGCAGCSEAGFVDTMTPLYNRLPSVPGFGVETTATKFGKAVIGITAAVFGVHGIINIIRNRGTVAKVESQRFEEDTEKVSNSEES